MDGFQVKVMRLRAGLTLTQLQQRCTEAGKPIHRARISEMERGERPVSDTLVAVLQAVLDSHEVAPR